MECPRVLTPSSWGISVVKFAFQTPQAPLNLSGLTRKPPWNKGPNGIIQPGQVGDTHLGPAGLRQARNTPAACWHNQCTYLVSTERDWILMHSSWIRTVSRVMPHDGWMHCNRFMTVEYRLGGRMLILIRNITRLKNHISNQGVYCVLPKRPYPIGYHERGMRVELCCV